MNAVNLVRTDWVLGRTATSHSLMFSAERRHTLKMAANFASSSVYKIRSTLRHTASTALVTLGWLAVDYTIVTNGMIQGSKVRRQKNAIECHLADCSFAKFQSMRNVTSIAPPHLKIMQPTVPSVAFSQNIQQSHNFHKVRSLAADRRLG